MKKITIITATYQSQSTIIDTLNSVNNQTYENIEHIIIDGESRDGTLDIISLEGKRIAKVVSEKDNGIYDAYNKGLSFASGEIIGFLNSDDFYSSNQAIEKVMSAFNDTSIDACYADLVYVDCNDTSKITRYWKSKPYKTDMLKNAFIPAHPTLFLRRSVYDKVGGFDISFRLAADYEFMIRVFKQKNIKSVYIPEILVRMRTGGATGGSLSSIYEQNKEIASALKKNGIKFSSVIFASHKLADRMMQRVRAFLI